MARRQVQYFSSLGGDTSWKDLLASIYKSAKQLTRLPFEDFLYFKTFWNAETYDITHPLFPALVKGSPVHIVPRLGVRDVVKMIG